MLLSHFCRECMRQYKDPIVICLCGCIEEAVETEESSTLFDESSCKKDV